MLNKIISNCLILLIILTCCAIGTSVVGFIYAGNVLNQYPDKASIMNSFDQISYIYDTNDQPVKNIHGGIHRKVISIDNIPEQVQNAFIAIEDVRFYSHHGVDPIGIGRAAIKDLMTKEATQGGSTITQQLMKQTFLSTEKSILRKTKEIFLALYAETQFTKQEILEMYLNRVYFGEGAYGIQSASEVYFGKEPAQLTLEEGALLAGLLQAPSYYDPVVNPEQALDRRNIVLGVMHTEGFIDDNQLAQAEATPIHLTGRKTSNDQSYILDYIIAEANKILDDEGLLTQGIKIYTTYDPKMQKEVDGIIDGYRFPDQVVQTALVVMENQTGAVKAMVGGRKYNGNFPLNRATQMYRQPGSSFKPISVYAPAFEKGYTPNSRVDDLPLTIGKYSPKNSDGGYYGRISIRQAIKWSRNVAAVWLLNKIGVENGFKMAQKLNFNLPASDNTLAIALGGITKGVTPLQMSAAYAAFASRGSYQDPFIINRIEDAAGNTIYQHTPKKKQVMKKETAEYLTSSLETAVNEGTGTRARVAGVSVAGKTGTTELPNTAQYRGLKGNKDNWFCGFTPNYAAAVWVGYDEKDMNRNRYLRTYGGDISADIFGKIMTKFYAGEIKNNNRFNYNLKDSKVVEEPKPLEEKTDEAENPWFITDDLLKDPQATPETKQEQQPTGVKEAPEQTETQPQGTNPGEVIRPQQEETKQEDQLAPAAPTGPTQ